MKNNSISVGIVSLVLMVCSLAIIVSQPQVVRASSTLFVGGSGVNNYTTIQEAVNAALPGDTIYVYDDNSPYMERIVIDNTINLVGENRDTTIIHDNGNWVVTLNADWTNITGFTIEGVTHSISVSSSNCNISGNRITSTYYGLDLYEASNIRVADNVFVDDGIKIRGNHVTLILALVPKM